MKTEEKRQVWLCSHQSSSSWLTESCVRYVLLKAPFRTTLFPHSSLHWLTHSPTQVQFIVKENRTDARLKVTPLSIIRTHRTEHRHVFAFAWTKIICSAPRWRKSCTVSHWGAPKCGLETKCRLTTTLKLETFEFYSLFLVYCRRLFLLKDDMWGSMIKITWSFFQVLEINASVFQRTL